MALARRGGAACGTRQRKARRPARPGHAGEEAIGGAMPSLSTPTRVMGMQNFPTLVRTGAARFADSTAKFEVGSVTKMGRRLIGKQAMTGAERQARYRA